MGENNVAELIRRTKCDDKTCSNFGSNCIVQAGSHSSIGSNQFIVWDNEIKRGKATLDAPSLSIRGVPVSQKKSKAAISNNNSNIPIIPSPYPPYFSSYPTYFPPPQPYTPSPYSPHFPLTPIAPMASTSYPNPIHTTPTQSTQPSSPIDFTIPKAQNIGAYIDWLIKRIPNFTEALQDAKHKLIDECVDLDTLKSMTVEDAKHWGIKWGLGKLLIRDIKLYLRENNAVGE
jgi:hypothetical protein